MAKQTVDPRNQLLRNAFFYALGNAGYTMSATHPTMSARVYNNTGKRTSGLRRKVAMHFGLPPKESAKAAEVVYKSVKSRFAEYFDDIELRMTETGSGWALYVKFNDKKVTLKEERPTIVKATKAKQVAKIVRSGTLTVRTMTKAEKRSSPARLCEELIVERDISRCGVVGATYQALQLSRHEAVVLRAQLTVMLKR